MQYGELITRSFTIAWRHRYLWLLAILGGADVGSCSPFRGNTGTQTFNPGTPQQVGQFLQQNLGLVLAAILVALVLALAWFLLSCVTTGALVRASAEHDAERPFGLGWAWRTGLGNFWSILGLKLIQVLLTLAALAVVSALVLFGVLLIIGIPPGGASGTQAGGVALVVAGAFLLVVLIPLSILAGIVFIVATRSVVLEQRRVGAALRRSLGLLRDRFGRTLLVWLLQVALSIGAGIVLAVPLLIVGGIAAGVIGGAAAGGGTSAAVVAGVPFGLLVLVLLIVVVGAVNAYFSTYWTLAFRRLELDPPPQAVAWPGYPPSPPAGYSRSP
ncbi:MAG: hypothetical protein J2P45_09215 [Candidatus Dormibacteraeota bacterium]|nr:hypothetical protein [Candidatus Dormibacteraeota bacterium]